MSTVKTRLYQGLTVLRRELDRQGIETAGAKAARPAPAVRPATSPVTGKRSVDPMSPDPIREYRLVRPLAEPT